MANLKGRAKARVKGPRRAFGMLALVWNLWRRLPPKRRRQVLGLARKHGPKLIRRAVKTRRTMKRMRRSR